MDDQTTPRHDDDAPLRRTIAALEQYYTGARLALAYKTNAWGYGSEMEQLREYMASLAETIAVLRYLLPDEE